MNWLQRLWDRLNGIDGGVYDCCEHCDGFHPGGHRDAPCLHKGCEQSREVPGNHGLAA